MGIWKWQGIFLNHSVSGRRYVAKSRFSIGREEGSRHYFRISVRDDNARMSSENTDGNGPSTVLPLNAIGVRD